MKRTKWKKEWSIAHAILGATAYTFEGIDVSVGDFVGEDIEDCDIKHLNCDDAGEARFEIACAAARAVMQELDITED